MWFKGQHSLSNSVIGEKPETQQKQWKRELVQFPYIRKVLPA